ncbi:MAG: hypothetical protein ACK4SQ_09800, partial [Allorhizobium sp.]
AEVPARVVRSAAAMIFIVVYLREPCDRTAWFDEMYLAQDDWDYNTPLRTIEPIGSVRTLGITVDT